MMRFAFWSTAAWRQYPIDEKLGHEKLPVLYVFEMSCTNILRFHMGTVHKKVVLAAHEAASYDHFTGAFYAGNGFWNDPFHH